MKNILGTTERLEFYNREGKVVYLFYKYRNGNSCEHTYNKNGKVLTFKDSDGFYFEYTRDENGKELTFRNSDGVKRGFDIPEFTMEELTQKLGNFKIKK
jgi:YD repeat-containing protein